MAELTVHYITDNYDLVCVALDSMFEKTSVELDVKITVNYRDDLDPRLHQLPEKYPQVSFLYRETRDNFAVIHNRAMEKATTPYIALLNDDIQFENDALGILVEYLQMHADVGLVGPQLFNADGSLQASAYSDPTVSRMVYKISGLAGITRQDGWLRPRLLKLGVGRFMNVDSLQTGSETRPVDIIKGAFMVVRRTAYEQAGMMHEDTMYGEEVEWHYRVRQAGWQVVLVPAARITHFGKSQMRLDMKGSRLIGDRLSILNWFKRHGTPAQAQTIRYTLLLFHGLYGLAWTPFDAERAATHRQIVRAVSRQK
jgi:GT2 family glycosyltransferase